MAPPAELTQWLNRTYPKPRVDPEWLDACYDWVITEFNLRPATDMNKIIEHVESQLLQSNLNDSMLHGTGLPLHVSKERNFSLIGPVLVEITALTDIGHSAFSLQNVRQTRIDRADLAGLAEDDGGEDDGPVPKYPRSMLRFELSDGATTLPAIEYRKIPNLELGETPLGYKMLLKNVPIKGGIAFLEPQNIELKGHQTEDRDAHRERDFVRSLRVRMHGLEALEDEPEGDPPAPHNDPGPAPPNPVPAPDRAPVPVHAQASAPVPAPVQRPIRGRMPPAQPLPGPRSPLRELSRSPPPVRPPLDDDGPRRRRIPSQSIKPPSSSGATLVQSSYFSGTTAAGPSALSSSRLQDQPKFSPTRTALDLIDTDEDEPPPKAQTRSEPPMGSAARPIPIEQSTQYFFDEEMEDPEFLAGLDQVMASQDDSLAATSQARTIPGASTSRTPVTQNPPPSRIPDDVIEIVDDDDDKENTPVASRRVRPRMEPTFDPDVIELSD